jgi:hypothetical protein
VASIYPRIFYICKAHGPAFRSAIELLISNPLKSRAPVAPALVERASRQLVGNSTLQRSKFLSTGLGPFEGFAYTVRSHAVLMPTVVAMAVRCGCALSGDAAARVVGDVGVRT